ncbi:MAG: LytTR family transcriptional regulator DNA-binding domain-containing protein, partial [Clostridiales bacterium]
LNYKSFVTCYRCILVNMNKIEKVEEGFFLMKNGEYVPINRNRAREIKNRYIDYIFGEMEIDANV